ncbi:MAG TPA: iron ABC transporter substrate-binding protein [Candidatus Corynebacterium gallistercoris]|uniref:Iron ABC transporter substrate-binding protein n=1 Tax=Candidatus Corynebacterium gallistercoris TaxID=2838530 RepID=A0A9D1RXS2_9CORY|nr:iron ABC transporter substrate-binding protein [Candidatus Corynebacterium gallistercoris]
MSRTFAKSGGFIVAATGAALILSGCASADDNNSSAESTTAEAKVTSLVVYSGRNEELIQPLIDKFEASHDIKVDVRYGKTTEMAATILEEGKDSPAEVFLSQDAGALGAVAGQDLLVKLPNDVTSLVAEDYTSKDGSWVGLTGRARVAAYDSEDLKADEVPADVHELTKPEWKGKVGIAPGNASFQSFVTAMRVMEGEDAAREWLQGLKDNDVQIFGKNGEILEAVNNGSLPVGLINHYYWARSESDPKDQRAQLKFGEAGTVSALVNVTGAGILPAGENSEAAMEFVKFLLSEEGQKYFLEETAEYPLVEGMGTPADVPPLEDLGGPDINLSDLDSLEETVQLITEVGLL